MFSQAVAQPAPAVSAPQQAASQAAPTPSPPTATVPVQPGYNAITVQLQPEAKTMSWLDPTVLSPMVAFLVLLYSIWATRRNLEVSAAATDKQIGAAADNMNRQIDHAREAADKKAVQDRDDARMKRIMEARQDIYMEIMADYQKVQAQLGGLLNPDTKFEGETAISVMSTSVNKLWIWGEVESAFQAREFYSQVNEFYFEALAKAMAIKKARDRVKELREGHAGFKKIIEHRTEERRQLWRAPAEHRVTDDWRRTEHLLQMDIRNAAAEKQAFKEAYQELEAKIALRHDSYLEFVIEKQTALGNQINVVMASARIDVGLLEDVTKLNEQSHAMSRRVRAAVEKLRLDHAKELEYFFPSTQA